MSETAKQKAADTRKARALLTGWGHEVVEGTVKELSAAFAEVREQCAKKCDEVVRSYSGGTFNDREREMRAAVECAIAIRKGDSNGTAI